MQGLHDGELHIIGQVGHNKVLICCIAAILWPSSNFFLVKNNLISFWFLLLVSTLVSGFGLVGFGPGFLGFGFWFNCVLSGSITSVGFPSLPWVGSGFTGKVGGLRVTLSWFGGWVGGGLVCLVGHDCSCWCWLILLLNPAITSLIDCLLSLMLLGFGLVTGWLGLLVVWFSAGVWFFSLLVAGLPLVLVSLVSGWWVCWVVVVFFL